MASRWRSVARLRPPSCGAGSRGDAESVAPRTTVDWNVSCPAAGKTDGLTQVLFVLHCWVSPHVHSGRDERGMDRWTVCLAEVLAVWWRTICHQQSSLNSARSRRTTHSMRTPPDLNGSAGQSLEEPMIKNMHEMEWKCKSFALLRRRRAPKQPRLGNKRIHLCPKLRTLNTQLPSVHIQSCISC